MQLYIIRHGDPDYANDTLTEYGWEQAKLLAKRMKDINPDIIYSSPRGRAKATAQPTIDLLKKVYSIEDWTTESMDYMQYPDMNDSKINSKSWKASFSQGIYDFDDYADINRKEVIENLKKSSDEFLLRHGYKHDGLAYKIIEPNDNKIAVFCHGGFGSNWISHLLSLPPVMGWMQFSLDTTSVTKFVFDNMPNGYTFARCIYMNNTSHLKV